MSHKFRLKQMIRLVNTPPSDRTLTGNGEYEIVRLMPADATGEVSYRIKAGNTERAVRESEIKG